MHDIVNGIATSFGCTARIELTKDYPPLVNNAVQTKICVSVLEDLVGADAVEANVRPTMSAEDFAHMLQVMPGCHVFIGNGSGVHRYPGRALGPCSLHNGSYDFNDELPPVGATYRVRLAENILASR